MLSQLPNLIIHLISQAGYFSVFGLMTLESALIPVPSEITLPFAGFLAQQGRFALPLVILFATLGDVAGTLIAYAIGYFLEEAFIVRLIDKYGKFLLLSRDEYDKIMHWMQTKGAIILIVAKLLPGFRTIIGLPAGLSEIPLPKTILYTFIGSFIWCSVFSYVGFVLGSKWDSLSPLFRKFELAIIVVVVVGIVWYINHKLKIVK